MKDEPGPNEFTHAQSEEPATATLRSALKHNVVAVRTYMRYRKPRRSAKWRRLARKNTSPVSIRIGTIRMTDWTTDELDKIGEADELDITVRRADGTSRKPVTIWVVRDADALYVRSGYGDRAAWYRAALRSREGQISAGGVQKAVRFADADPAANDRIDAAYRSKYMRHGARWVNPMVATEARPTTIKLVPL